MADRYLLDTNVYFEILRYVSSGKSGNAAIDNVLRGECFISRITQIEIVSVIGKYARGESRGVQICERVHVESNSMCGKRYVIEGRKKLSRRTVNGWLQLEREISMGLNGLFTVTVLDIDEGVMVEAERFIQNALFHNFKSMDAIIVGTAIVYSKNLDSMTVVTADKSLKAGLDEIGYPNMSVV